jgi:hypothetical protein
MDKMIEGKRLPLDEIRFAQLQVLESDEGKPTTIEGVASIADAINANNRVYPLTVLKNAAKRANALLNRHPGLVDHPRGASSVADAGIRYTALWMDGKELKFRGEIIPTRKGLDLEAVVRSGIEVGISTRGYGSVKAGTWEGEDTMIVQDDYELEAPDAVLDPSVLDARIQTYEDAEATKELTLDQLRENRPDLIAALEQEILELNDLNEAVWTTKAINDLPDSSFAYIEPGGTKDSDGKTTPRSLRHFPFKDADGKLDAPHIRNALARIPQSSLPQDAKDQALAVIKRAAKSAGISVGDAKEAEETDIIEEPMDKPTVNEEAAQEAVTSETSEEVLEEAPAAETTEVSEVQAEENPTEPVQDEPVAAQVETESVEAETLEETKGDLTEVTAERDDLAEDVKNFKDILTALGKQIADDLSREDFYNVSSLAYMGQQAQGMRDDEINAAVRAAVNGVEAAMTRIAADNLGRYIREKCQPERFGLELAAALTPLCHTKEEVDAQFAPFKARLEAEHAGTPQAITRGVVDHEDDLLSPRDRAIRDSVLRHRAA